MEYAPVERTAGAFQQPLTADQIQAICAAAFGTAADVERVTELTAGMFNNTFLVTRRGHGTCVLRVGPARDVFVFAHEAHLLQRESHVEPYLAVLGERAPRTLFADFSRRVLDRDYVFQTFLAGELWDEVKDDLDADENADLWRQLGALSAVIHGVTGLAFGFPPPQRPFPDWHRALRAIVQGMQRDLRTLALDDSGVDAFLSLLDAGALLLNQIDRPRLIHGDLWPKNVLIRRKPDGRPIISGLLDAERAFWGDPLAEWIYAMLDVLPAYWEGYADNGRHGRAVSGERDTAARFRAQAYRGLYSVQLFLEAWRFGYDDGFARDSLVRALVAMRELLK